MSFVELTNYSDEDFEYTELHSENKDGYQVKDITINSTLGKVSAYLVIPNGDGPFPAIHFVHWLETHAENSNRTQFLPMAEELAIKGYLSLLPDCFWSVDKDKFEKDPASFTKNWWKTDVKIDTGVIRKQVIELARIQDYILSREDVDKSRIALAAHDFGAMFGTLLSSMRKMYKTYTFMAATSRFSDWFRFGSKLSEEELKPYIEALDYLDPMNHINNLSPASGLLMFADDDFYVPEHKAKELFEAAGEPKEIRWYNAKHGMNEQAYTDMKNWIIEKL